LIDVQLIFGGNNMKMNWFRPSITLVLLSLLLSACGGNSSSSPSPNAESQMGGAIQGKPLSLSQSVSTLAGSAGISGSTDGTGAEARFNSLWGGITTDGKSIYVVDSNNFTIRKVVIATGAVTTLAGSAGSSGSTEGTGAEARFNFPSGITTDGTNLFVADVSDIGNYTIRKVTIATGKVTTLAGNDGSLGAVVTITPTVQISFPQSVTTDGTNVYVTGGGNFTIRKVVIATGAVTTLAGSAGSSGSTDGTGMGASFNFPIGIATDGTNLFVTDVSDIGNYIIRKVAIATGTVTTLAVNDGSIGSIHESSGVVSPQGITTDGTNVYVADSGDFTIRKVVIATGAVTTMAGSAGSSGKTDGTGAVARFASPHGITTDGINLFVADNGNYTIRKID
jgi:sugar lactone lactonase YvrE